LLRQEKENVGAREREGEGGREREREGERGEGRRDTERRYGEKREREELALARAFLGFLALSRVRRIDEFEPLDAASSGLECVVVGDCRA